LSTVGFSSTRSLRDWQTRKREDGLTEWSPPPHLDRGQPRINLFHHPEKLLREDNDENDP